MYFFIIFLTCFPYMVLIAENILHIPLSLIISALFIPIICRIYYNYPWDCFFSEYQYYLVIIGFFFLYCLGHKIKPLRYYLFLWLFYVFIMSTTALFIPVFLWKPFHQDNLLKILEFWKKWIPMFGLTIEIRGKENLKSKEPCVFVSNHQSAVDMITLVQTMPSNTTIVAKREVIYLGSFGLAAWLCGVVFINRRNHSSAINTMKHASTTMMEKKVSVWIFPEGTRNMNGFILPFKKGAFHLAVETQAPISPVVLSPYNKFLDHKLHIFEKGHIVATFLPQIPTKGLTASDVSDLAKSVHDQMEEVFLNKSTN